MMINDADGSRMRSKKRIGDRPTDPTDRPTDTTDIATLTPPLKINNFKIAAHS